MRTRHPLGREAVSRVAGARRALSDVRPEVLLRQVDLRVAGGHPHDVRPAEAAVTIILREALLHAAVVRRDGGVLDEACQEVHAVHHRVVREGARELDHILHLHAPRSSRRRAVNRDAGGDHRWGPPAISNGATDDSMHVPAHVISRCTGLGDL